MIRRLPGRSRDDYLLPVHSCFSVPVPRLNIVQLMLEIEINIIWFIAVVVIGAVVQTIAGFAMGLVTMAGIILFGIVDIAFSAAVVSFMSYFMV